MLALQSPAAPTTGLTSYIKSAWRLCLFGAIALDIELSQLCCPVIQSRQAPAFASFSSTTTIQHTASKVNVWFCPLIEVNGLLGPAICPAPRLGLPAYHADGGASTVRSVFESNAPGSSNYPGFIKETNLHHGFTFSSVFLPPRLRAVPLLVL